MALKRSNKIIAGILATVLTLTNIPVIARDWIKTSDNTTTAESESEYYYHFSNGYHITWSGSDGQRWSDGEPYSSQSTTVTLKKSDIDNLLTNLPSAQGKTIKDIIYKRYTDRHDATIPEWNQPLFGFWKTKLNTGKAAYFGKYSEHFAQDIIHTSSYNARTGEFTYTLNYKLYTSDNKHGIELHTEYWQYFQNAVAKGYTEDQAHSEAQKECNNLLRSYFGNSAPTVDWNKVGRSKDFRVVVYVLPGVFRFEVEKEEPGVSITALPDTEPKCAEYGIEGSSIQLVINRPRKEWLKTTGKVIFTDATGQNKEFKIEKDIKPEQFKNNFLSMSWCIPFDVTELLVTYIPDPANPKETYEETFTIPKNDLGIGNITLQNNNKNVSTPTPNANHTTKIELVNLGDKVVGKPTIDITVTEVGKTEPFYKDTVTVDTDLKGNATVTIPSNTFKPTSNKIEVCGVVNQTHTDKNDNIKNDNDKKCQKFEGVQDMALSKNVSLLNKEGKEVPEIVQGENMTIVFRPKNIAGSQPVGLDSKTNPLATLEVKVTDNKTGNVIYSGGYVKATEVIQPGGLVEVEVENVKIPANTLEIKACATIKDIHDTLGFNIRNNEHDTVCKVFGTTKNYAVKDLVLDKTRVEASGKKVPVVFKFTVANEAPGDKESFPEIIIEQVGKGKIWSSSSIAIQAGKEKTISVPIVLNPLPAGNATFKVTVNPNKTETEYKTGVSDPYKDNSKSTAITAYATPACVGCSAKNTSNNWVEELPFSRVIYNKYLAHVGHNKNGDCIYEWVCSKPETVSGTKKVSYFEKYYIDSIKVKTKWSEDNASKYSHIDNKTGWATVYSTNSPTVKTIKVKAGSYIELETTTKYETDRDKKVSAPENVANAKGECSTGPIEEPQTPSPSVFADHTYAKMQTESNCIVLATDLRSDPLGGYNYKAMRNFPERKDLSGSGLKQRIYIPQGTKVGTYTLTINTEIAQGINKPYKVSGTDKKLQDCVTINIEVVSNNDIVTGIIQ